MRVAVVISEAGEAGRARWEAAASTCEDLLAIAPPEVADRLEISPSAWFTATAADPLAAPVPQLQTSAAVRKALLAAHAERPLGEVRFDAADGSAWATAIHARQSGELRGVRVVAGLDAASARRLTAPLRLGASWHDALFRQAVRASLRDADEVVCDTDARAALEESGWRLAVPPPAAAWGADATPAVSAIVTHKDLERYLPECLASLRAQTVPVEIVLVEDGSRPEGRAVALEEARKDPAIKLVETGGVRLARARNMGIEVASGELVFIVDADNVMRPRCVEALREALRRRGGSYAAPAFRRFDDGDGATIDAYCPSELWPPTLFILNTGGDACALHRRQDLLAAGGYRDELNPCEDWGLWLEYAARGLTGAVVPEVLFDYRVRAQSMFRVHPRVEILALPFRHAARHAELLARHFEETAILAAARRLEDAEEAAEISRQPLRSRAHVAEVRAAALDAEASALRVSAARLDAELSALRISAAALDAEVNTLRVRAAELDAHIHSGLAREAALAAEQAELRGRLAATEAEARNAEQIQRVCELRLRDEQDAAVRRQLDLERRLRETLVQLTDARRRPAVVARLERLLGIRRDA